MRNGFGYGLVKEFLCLGHFQKSILLSVCKVYGLSQTLKLPSLCDLINDKKQRR